MRPRLSHDFRHSSQDQVSCGYRSNPINAVPQDKSPRESKDDRIDNGPNNIPTDLECTSPSLGESGMGRDFLNCQRSRLLSIVSSCIDPWRLLLIEKVIVGPLPCK